MELNNEEKVVLRILKDYSTEYNANSISKLLNLTSMGSLKILKRLEKQKILTLRKVSNIRFYYLNFENQYAKDYASLILRKESDNCSSVVKRWVNEIRKIGIVDVAIIFGSILKGKNAQDVDILFVVNEKNFSKLKEGIGRLNAISEKKVHVVYQTKNDFLKNLKNKDEVVQEIVKGIVVIGERDLVNLMEEVK